MRAYELLGQDREALESLASHFSAAALKAIRSAIDQHAAPTKGRPIDDDGCCAHVLSAAKKRNPTLKSLCQALAPDSFEPFVMATCKQLCNLMANYRAMEAVHVEEDVVNVTDTEDESEREDSCISPVAEDMNGREQQAMEVSEESPARPPRDQQQSLAG